MNPVPQGYCRLLRMSYLFGAPGVGTCVATDAPLACGFVKPVVRVMPLPEICAPEACACVSGAVTVIVAPAPPRPPLVDATTAVS